MQITLPKKPKNSSRPIFGFFVVRVTDPVSDHPPVSDQRMCVFFKKYEMRQLIIKIYRSIEQEVLYLQVQ